MELRRIINLEESFGDGDGNATMRRISSLVSAGSYRERENVFGNL
jgi:hypothetical protein